MEVGEDTMVGDDDRICDDCGQRLAEDYSHCPRCGRFSGPLGSVLDEALSLRRGYVAEAMVLLAVSSVLTLIFAFFFNETYEYMWRDSFVTVYAPFATILATYVIAGLSGMGGVIVLAAGRTPSGMIERRVPLAIVLVIISSFGVVFPLSLLALVLVVFSRAKPSGWSQMGPSQGASVDSGRS